MTRTELRKLLDELDEVDDMQSRLTESRTLHQGLKDQLIEGCVRRRVILANKLDTHNIEV